MQGYHYLAKQFIRHHRLRFVFLTVSIVVGIGSLFVLLSLQAGVQQILTSKAIASLGVNEIVVKPAFRTGVLAVNKEEKKEMTPETINAIRELPNVKAVFPTVILQLPTSIRVEAMGNTFESDAPVFGIDPSLVREDISNPSNFSVHATPVGIVLSKDILEFFNAGFADSLGLPKINEEYLTGTTVGKNVTLQLGYSSFLGFKGENVVNVPARIVGFSNKVPLIGVSLPLEVVQSYSRQFNKGEGKINSLLVRVQDPSYVDQVISSIEEMGYETDSLQKRIGGINDNIKILSLIVGIIAFVILLSAAIALLNTFFSDVVNSTKTIGLLRSVGATKGFIMLLFLSKSLSISLIGGVIGTFVGGMVVLMINQVLWTALPFYLNAQLNISIIPWQLPIETIIFAIVLGVLATIYPAYYAARLDPVEALRK